MLTKSIVVVIEDFKATSRRFNQDVIDTIKFIGELEFRLKNTLNVDLVMVTRGKVKQWVFNTFPDACLSRIEKKIADTKKKNDDGKDRKPSFHWVDDRIVMAAMRELWNIPVPKPGKSNIYGLKTHSWQALACASYYLFSEGNQKQSSAVGTKIV